MILIRFSKLKLFYCTADSIFIFDYQSLNMYIKRLFSITSVPNTLMYVFYFVVKNLYFSE